MKIAALGGSLRQGSYAYKVLDIAFKSIHDPDIQTQIIDLRQLTLPFCNGGKDYYDFPDVKKLREAVRSSSGLLIATPEYHGNMSGVIKNALDLLDEEHLHGKVVGLIAVIGGVHSTNAINTLRLVCRQLHCWVLPEQIVIPHVATAFSLEGDFVDKQIEERLSKMVHHLIDMCRKLHLPN
jgi:NAD(P)H-dependent FMN reductase